MKLQNKKEGKMETERKARLKQIREQLANLDEEQRQVLLKRGLIATVEGRQLSLHNTLLVYLQCNGHNPTVVGGYQQWRKAGKQVKRGEHGYTIFFPVGNKDKDSDLIEAERFFTTTVFDIAQVETK